MWQAIWLPKLATILLALSSKSDICSLLHFGCFSREGTNSRPSFSLELFLIKVLFKIGPSREKQQFLPSAIYICRKFQIAYYTNICWSEGDIFLLAQMRQRHFIHSLSGSLRNDPQSDRIPHPCWTVLKIAEVFAYGSSDCIMKSKLLGNGGVSTLHNLYNKQFPILTSDRQNRTLPNSLR